MKAPTDLSDLNEHQQDFLVIEEVAD